MMLLTKCCLAKSVPIVIPNVRGVLPAWVNSCSDPGGRQGRLLPSFYSQEAAEVTALVTCPARSDPESLCCCGRGADSKGAAEGLGGSWYAQIQMQRLPGVGCRGPGGVGEGGKAGWGGMEQDVGGVAWRGATGLPLGKEAPGAPAHSSALGLEVRVWGSFRLALFLTSTCGQVPIAL